jgi:nicotinamidase/pyrazinamidase
MGSSEPLGSGDALILVDVQQDFCPGGSLPIEQGHNVVPVLNRWIEDAVQAGVPVFASRDWHPAEHLRDCQGSTAVFERLLGWIV